MSCRIYYRAFIYTFVFLLMSLVQSTFGQSYPSRPIKFIAPFPPGGTSDVLGRLIAQKLSEGLGQPVILENRPGASGNIGHDLAAKAKSRWLHASSFEQ
jgi:tripartite-type tricarboxylate transporter receptor subunit TctC